MNFSFWLLFILLLCGLIFFLLPTKYLHPFVGVKSTEYQTKDIRAIILFVSARKVGDPFESLLAYKILSQMIKGKGRKRVWLFHSLDSSSKPDADALYSEFNVHDNLQITQHAIKDINHSDEAYNEVNRRVFSDKSLDVGIRQICCDCTAGTKPLTLGFALASLGRGKLIYFPMATQQDALKYIVINANPPKIADIEP